MDLRLKPPAAFLASTPGAAAAAASAAAHEAPAATAAATPAQAGRERSRRLATLVDQVSTIVVGKRPQVEDCIACLLAGGHLLIEDVPGVGKTTLAHTLAISLGLEFRRVQFTADLLPSDLVGVSVFERAQDRFVFHPGPLFAQVLLADEINRAGPKTQSALLEAMEEQQVTVENETRALPAPFFVIATQNPSDQLGTYPLPESQLDRFLMRITLGYPDRASERELLAGGDRREALRRLAPVLTTAELAALQQAVLAVRASEPLLDYLQALIAATRNGRWFAEGLSPRAGIAVLRAARARALLAGRDYVAPDDVQAILPQTIAHRLVPVAGAGRGAVEQVQAMVEAIPVG
ncbi:MAG: AAA family ATPase [Rubrivivax sp.]|nr:AAA family ATPase [Rubrivivax sp.]